MYKLISTKRFKKDLKKVKKNPKDFESVTLILKMLALEGSDGIPKKMKPHKLRWDYNYPF